MLNIKTPLIIVSIPDGKRRSLRRTFIDDNEHPVGDIIYVIIQAIPRMIHSVTHELRHCWQEYNAQGYYKEYKGDWDDEESWLQYLNQKEEIDADAFASMYLNSLGYDGIRMAFLYDQDYKDPYWKEFIAALKKRIKEIESDRFDMIQNNMDKPVLFIE